MPIPSADDTEPAERRDEVAPIARWNGLIRNCGGNITVIGPDMVDRALRLRGEPRCDLGRPRRHPQVVLAALTRETFESLAYRFG